MNTRMTCPDAFFNTGKGAGDEGEDALARGLGNDRPHVGSLGVAWADFDLLGLQLQGRDQRFGC